MRQRTRPGTCGEEHLAVTDRLGRVAVTALVPASTPWFVWAALVAGGLSSTVTHTILDDRLRRHALKTMPAQCLAFRS